MPTYDYIFVIHDSLQSSAFRGCERLQDSSVAGGDSGNPKDSLQSSGLRGWEELWDNSAMEGTVGIPGTPRDSGDDSKIASIHLTDKFQEC